MSLIAKPRAKSEPPPAATVRLAVGPGTVARALAAARAFAEAGALEADLADRLALVVEEWVANIVEHGASPAGALVVLRLAAAGEGGVRLSFSDAGVAFDPRSVEAAGPNPQRGGGAGIAMIRAWCEVEAYARRRGRNRLILRLRRSD